VEVKKSRRYEGYDPFILAQKARQVYYVDYPETCRNLRDWCVAITTKPRGYVEVDGVEDAVPYQAEEMPNVDLTEEIEQIHGLADPATLYEEEEDEDDDNEGSDNDNMDT
jgi:hypothetical protein